MPHPVPRPVRARRAVAPAALALLLLAGPAAAQGPQFTDEVLEITAARLDALVRGLDAEAAARPAVEREHAAGMARYEAAVAAQPARQAEYERAIAAWRARTAAYEACQKKHVDAFERAAAASPGRAAMMAEARRLEDPSTKAQLEKRVAELRTQIQAAQARGDQKALMALADSAQRLMQPMAAAGRQGAAHAQQVQGQAEATEAAIRAECGEDPEGARPKSPPSPNTLLPAAAHERLEETGARAAGVGRRQYAVLKERVGAYLALTKHGAGIATQYAFAPGERSALDAALPALQRRPETLDW